MDLSYRQPQGPARPLYGFSQIFGLIVLIIFRFLLSVSLIFFLVRFSILS